MSQIQFTFIARATAFAGTGEEKTFGVEFDDTDVAEQAKIKAQNLALAYEAENAQVALFAKVEAAQGKKLTKPQRELLALTLSIQGGTYEDKSVETETVQPEPKTVETAKEKVEAVQEKKVIELPPETFDEEVNADEVVKQAIAEDTAEQGKESTDDAVEDALAALGL